MGRGHYILCLLTFCTKFGTIDILHKVWDVGW
nr:MAG TPA: hypothetical protein [Bacteriophage sp.]